MTLALVAASYTVIVNGSLVHSDVAPLMQRGRILLPARAIFGALGADVSYDAKTGHVMVRRGTRTVQITIGSDLALVDGTPIRLDVPAQIYDGRTMVPLRFVAQGLGASVAYVPLSRTISIAEPNASALRSGDAPNVVADFGPSAQSYAHPNPTPYVQPPYAQPQVPTPYVQPGYAQSGYAQPQYALPLSAFVREDAVTLALGAPVGGSGYVSLCGFGNAPLIYDPTRGAYFAKLALPRNVYQSECSVTGTFYDPSGGAHPLVLPAPFAFDTRPRSGDRRPAPTPAPTPTPAARPTTDPAHTRYLEKATPTPSASPRSLVRVL